MISLADYFTPLNLLNLFYISVFLLFFDIIGHFLNFYIIRSDRYFRIANWLFGLGAFIFLWFLLGFIIPLKAMSILFSMAILILISIPSYLKYKGFFRFVTSIWEGRFFILISLPTLYIVWIKSSLPPYLWDEMSYHFLSPFNLSQISTWNFGTGLYSNLPRNLETLFLIIFSFTKTYSVARFINFFIFYSALLSISSWLKKEVNNFSSIIFFSTSLYLYPDLLSLATSGYVDIAASSFILLAIVAGLNSLINKNNLKTSAAFWGLSIGTKYVGLTAFISFSIIVLIYYILNNQTSKKIGELLISTVLVFVFGGYWYIKNLLYTGNPIFPFLFSCKPGFEICSANSRFFGDWTIPITLRNLPTLLSELLSGNAFMMIVFLITIPLAIFLPQNIKKILALITSIFIINMIVIKLSSGFLIRYYFYLQVMILFMISLITAVKIPIPRKIILFVFGVIAVFITVPSIHKSYSVEKLPKFEQEYAWGKVDIYGWVSGIFPQTRDFVFWCSNRNQIEEITTIDPDLIWFEFEGRMSIFLTNCRLTYSINFDGEVSKLISTLINEKRKFYVLSTNNCKSEVKSKHPAEDNTSLRLRQLNNQIVCSSQIVVPGLYYFDWQKAKI